MTTAPPPAPPAPLHPDPAYFTRTQVKWIKDDAPLKLMEKARQVGVTNATCYRMACIVGHPHARFDAFISTRDMVQAKLTLETCKRWSSFLDIAARDLGEILFDRHHSLSAYALEFANSRRIYALSSNPNALAGKCGHVVLDEFALHEDQRLLYRVAKPVTTWGGSFTIVSTHRGPNTFFNQIIHDIIHNGNPAGWNHYRYTLQQAVNEGLVERINRKSGHNDSRHAFIQRIRTGCLDEDLWKQEYCCIPCDETTAFITHDMISACEDPTLRLLTTDQLVAWLNSPEAPADPVLYLGLDVARKHDLCVIDVGIKLAGIMHDKLRIELDRQPFPAIQAALFPLLALPQVRRACIDENGIGMDLAERARLAFGSKVEPVYITAPVKEKLAFGLRNAFESLALRVPVDPKLHADIHAMKKQVTAANNIRFDGHTDDGHCDRFMAKALRQEAARPREEEPWALLC